MPCAILCLHLGALPGSVRPVVSLLETLLCTFSETGECPCVPVCVCVLSNRACLGKGSRRRQDLCQKVMGLQRFQAQADGAPALCLPCSVTAQEGLVLWASWYSHACILTAGPVLSSLDISKHQHFCFPLGVIY